MLIALMLLSFTACTTMRAIEDFSPSRIRARVEVGSEVHIVTRNGKVYDLTVTTIDSDSLLGSSSTGKRYDVAFEAIQYIEVKEGDVVKSVGATLAAVYVVLTAIFIYAFATLAHEGD